MIRNLALALAVTLLAGWPLAAVAAEPGPEGTPPRERPAPPDRDGRAGPPRRGPPQYGPWSPEHDGRPPSSHGGGSRMFHTPDQEQTEEVWAFVREHMPWRVEGLEKLRDERPEIFKAMIRRLQFEIGQLKRLRESDPKAFQAALEEGALRYRSMDLPGQIRQTDDPKRRKALTAELRGVVERLLEAEQKAREAQVRELEERLQRLREQIRERAEHRQQIVEELMERLLTEPQKPGGPESDARDEP